MRACFHWLGTVAVSSDMLIRLATGPQRTGAASLRNQAGSLPKLMVLNGKLNLNANFSTESKARLAQQKLFIKTDVCLLCFCCHLVSNEFQ